MVWEWFSKICLLAGYRLSFSLWEWTPCTSGHQFHEDNSHWSVWDVQFTVTLSFILVALSQNCKLHFHPTSSSRHSSRFLPLCLRRLRCVAPPSTSQNLITLSGIEAVKRDPRVTRNTLQPTSLLKIAMSIWHRLWVDCPAPSFTIIELLAPTPSHSPTLCFP